MDDVMTQKSTFKRTELNSLSNIENANPNTYTRSNLTQLNRKQDWTNEIAPITSSTNIKQDYLEASRTPIRGNHWPQVNQPKAKR